MAPRARNNAKQIDEDLRQRIIAAVLIVIALLAVAVFFLFRPAATVSHGNPNTQPSVVPSTVDLTSFHWEAADTDDARVNGLSNRASLGATDGMLFLFEKPGTYAFWMKEMKFPLDIIWVEKGVVVDAVTMPAPTSTANIPLHVPSSAADHVLEVNAGTAERLGIHQGVGVILPK